MDRRAFVSLGAVLAAPLALPGFRASLRVRGLGRPTDDNVKVWPLTRNARMRHVEETGQARLGDRRRKVKRHAQPLAHPRQDEVERL